MANTRSRRRAKQRRTNPLVITLIAGILLVVVILALPKSTEKQKRWETEGENRYYVDADGNRLTGWQQIGADMYYLDPDLDGAMHVGWLELTYGVYYLDKDGKRLTGWLELESGAYYLAADGKKQTGWVTLPEGAYYLGDEGVRYAGWLEMDGKRYYLVDGKKQTGWVEADGDRYYLDDAGVMQTGWLDQNGSLYYLGEDGAMHTGWLAWNGFDYYLKSDGTAAKGKLVIDEKTHYFTSKGAEVLLVNRWNSIPKSYAPEELVACKYNTSFSCKMTPEAVAALDKMIEACKAAGFSPLVRTGYRSYSYQQMLLDNKMNKGYSYEEAIKSVAVPGTSEHQTGLAVDISDSSYTNLNRQQGSLPIQKWLKEHCHEFGFIVRYPDDTTHLTGIIYESWHYRYVGVELATELSELGICLEEYLDRLTGDGTTCGDPASLS